MAAVYFGDKSGNNPNIADRMSPIMSSASLLLAFTESARRANFAAAARELGLSPSAVAKNVMRLEQQLGVRLFHRTTRRIGLTAEGEALYERCRRIVDELAALEEVATSATRTPGGVLRIDAPITYGKQVILPVCGRLAQRYPELRLDLRLSDEYADVIAGGLDAVIRVGAIADSRLVARQFDAQQLRVYGARGYLDRRGRPSHPRDLKDHDCLVFRIPTTGREYAWQFVEGRKRIELHPPSRYLVNDGEGLAALAASGLGLVQLPDYMARDAVKARQLEEVLVRYKPPPVPISIVFPSSRHVPLRLRVLIDALVEAPARPVPGSRARP
jgi:DNA-binding transcriptional LysR family regulator